jgi:hypothetical protein
LKLEQFVEHVKLSTRREQWKADKFWIAFVYPIMSLNFDVGDSGGDIRRAYKVGKITPCGKVTGHKLKDKK